MLFKTRDKQPNSQITAFEDTWYWNQASEDAFDEVIQSGNAKAVAAIEGLRQVLRDSNIMAYLSMMCVRLLELHKVLKPTGSLYLHCDPTASHYLKVVLDAIFGLRNFQNEVVWKRTGSHNRAKRWGPIHDVLLYYSKSRTKTWNRISQPYREEYLDSAYRYNDDFGHYRLTELTGPGTRTGDSEKPWKEMNFTERGRHWEPPPDRSLLDWFVYPESWSTMSVQERCDELDKQNLVDWGRSGNSLPRFKKYLFTESGLPLQDMVLDILSVSENEDTGGGTQKPVALLERIITTSSNKGDVILDPFCGCGTAIHAAEKTQRRWIGIDITYLVINIMEDRMKSAFPGITLKVNGLPQSVADARKLFELDPFQFELWAIQHIIPGMSVTSKTGDQGIDGIGRAPVGKDAGGRTKYAKIITSVRGGKHITPTYMNELQGNLVKHNTDMGVLLTLEDLPKRSEIRRICAKAGKYVIGTATGSVHYPVLQTFKIGDVFERRRPVLPNLMQSAAAAAPVIKRVRGIQSTLPD